MSLPRPKLCPDPSCEILFTDYQFKQFKQGASFHCWGRMREQIRWISGKTEHLNEYSHCVYTPLKGLIRFFLNADDAWTDIIGLSRLLDHAKPLECKACGESNRLTARFLVLKDGLYCSLCAYRLGKIRWYEQEKRYY